MLDIARMLENNTAGIALHPKYVPPLYRLQCPVCETPGYSTASILRNHIKANHTEISESIANSLVSELSAKKRTDLEACNIPEHVIAHYVR